MRGCPRAKSAHNSAHFSSTFFYRDKKTPHLSAAEPPSPDQVAPTSSPSSRWRVSRDDTGVPQAPEVEPIPVMVILLGRKTHSEPRYHQGVRGKVPPSFSLGIPHNDIQILLLAPELAAARVLMPEKSQGSGLTQVPRQSCTQDGSVHCYEVYLEKWVSLGQ